LLVEEQGNMKAASRQCSVWKSILIKSLWFGNNVTEKQECYIKISLK
jgi:hypothetical protein